MLGPQAPTVHSTTCEQVWICTVCIGRGKHVIFNSKTGKFWVRRVVEIANDFHLSLLTNFFNLEGLAWGYYVIYSRLGGVAGSNLSEYISKSKFLILELLSYIYRSLSFSFFINQSLSIKYDGIKSDHFSRTR